MDLDSRREIQVSGLGRPLGSLKASLIENSPSSNFHTQTIDNSKIGHTGMPTDHHFFKLCVNMYQNIGIHGKHVFQEVYKNPQNLCVC